MEYSIRDPKELQSIYERRFDHMVAYRMRVWETLVREYFQQFIGSNDAVLDLGCGYGEFINHVRCGKKFAMDLNARSSAFLNADVNLLLQDCSKTWDLPDSCLNQVFTSNFFEHLPDKQALRNTLLEAHRCLKQGGRIMALGPNIKYVPGAYWDFWDHFLCLTEMSLSEAMENNGFRLRTCIPRFLPYSMVDRPKLPISFVSLYLKIPLAWRFMGKQFLVIAEKV